MQEETLMTPKRSATPALLLVAAALALVACTPRPATHAAAQEGPAPAAGAPDSRTAVTLPVPARDGVLTEMRQMLGSVSAVVQALARGDVPAAEEAARSSGMTKAVDPHLREILPREFLTLGMDTHRRFDDLADAARAGASREELLSRLGRVTANCVACHATYRFAATP
jgi:hypothetical protein